TPAKNSNSSAVNSIIIPPYPDLTGFYRARDRNLSGLDDLTQLTHAPSDHQSTPSPLPPHFATSPSKSPCSSASPSPSTRSNPFAAPSPPASHSPSTPSHSPNSHPHQTAINLPAPTTRTCS